MKSPMHFFSIMFLSGILLSPEAFSQHKFEFGVSIAPLVVPVNFGTYVENGQGFYDINGRGKITQSGSAYFTYWPFNSFGISLGVGVRNFRSQIDYVIPDPFDESLDPVIERSYPYTAKGFGPSLSVLFRKEKWRARIGFAAIDVIDQEYISNYSISGSVWSSGGEVIANLLADENAYWHTVPSAYGQLQIEGQYNIFDNIFIKFGFETTISGKYPYPYTLLIYGFTPETPPQTQALNDYEMRNTLSSFSLGVGYIIGFGKYSSDRNNAKM